MTQMAQTTVDLSVKTLFGLPVPEKAKVRGFAAPGPVTPPADPDYHFRKELVGDFLCWHQARLSGACKDGVWLAGPLGSGKTTFVNEVAARLNQNVVQANGKRRLEMADWVGHLTAVGGDVLFEDGPLTRAARQGWWFLLNEADLVEPGELAGLNTLLDGGPLVIAENGGEVVWPAPGFGVLCTANTVGLGDGSGLYAATQRLNGAFMDRFWVLAVGYPPAAEEIEILRRAAPGLPPAIVEKMVEVAGAVRALFAGAGEGPAVEVTVSTRTLKRWALLALAFCKAPEPLVYSLRLALTNRAEPETAEAVVGIARRVFGGGN